MAITRDNLKKILALAGKNVRGTDQAPELTEYNWHRPRHFSNEQLDSLQAFAIRCAEHLEALMTTICQGEFYASVTTVTEHFAYSLVQQAETRKDHYYLPIIGANNSRVGIVAINPAGAQNFLRFLLCDNDTTDGNQPKPISILEESLLYDAAVTVTESLNRASEEKKGSQFRYENDLIQGLWPLPTEGLEEFCQIDFKVTNNQRTAEASIIILEQLLEPALKITADKSAEIDPAALEAAKSHNLLQANVKLETVLSKGMVPLSYITSLEPGDVLVLDRKVDEPIEVRINGTESLHAYPATCEGRYSLKITEKPEEA